MRRLALVALLATVIGAALIVAAIHFGQQQANSIANSTTRADACQLAHNDARQLGELAPRC